MGRVLVVEDDEAIADVLRRTLRQEGHEVRSAADGVEALAVAEEFIPDLVILDLGLPKLDGVEVLRRLRAESSTTGSRASTPGPTTIWSSRSSGPSCWRGSAR
jgi:DNA-binding response OmpR family regulator